MTDTIHPSTTSAARAVVEAYTETLAAGGPFEQYFADDVTFDMVGAPMSLRGRDEVAAGIRAAHFEVFDSAVEFVSLVVDDGGTKGAFEAIFAARHIGEFAGIPATGRDVRVPYSVHCDLADGHISALRAYGLLPGLLAALGS